MLLMGRGSDKWDLYRRSGKAGLMVIGMEPVAADPGALILCRMKVCAIARLVGILTGPCAFLHACERLGVSGNRSRSPVGGAIFWRAIRRGFGQASGEGGGRVAGAGAGQLRAAQTAGRPNSRSDAFSPIMIAGALVLPDTISGMIEQSATRNRSTP